VSDIQRESQAVLNSIKENYFHSAFEAWKKRWDRCIHSQGDYFEGDGSQHFFFDLQFVHTKPYMFCWLQIADD
jgi:hypothetical protein